MGGLVPRAGGALHQVLPPLLTEGWATFRGDGAGTRGELQRHRRLVDGHCAVSCIRDLYKTSCFARIALS